MIIFGRVEILNLQLSITVSNNTSVNASVTQFQNFRMADARYSRGKSPRRYRAEELSKSKMRRSRHHSRKEIKDTKQLIECKTPPLPSRSSLDDLLKQRDNLKEELNKISKQSKYDLEITHKLNDCNAKYNSSTNSRHGTKRNYFEGKNTHITKKNRKNEEDSPELDDYYLDSEDETNIIEQRRKQRKQLIEKLSVSSLKNKKSAKINEISDVKNLGTEESNNKNISEIMEVNKNRSYVEENNVSISNEHPSKQVIVKENADMFSEKDFISNQEAETVNTVAHDNSNIHLSDNWDDEEGYYKVMVGDVIDNNKYTIKSILGQGVFANVVLALDNSSKSDVAIKIMRNNDLIYKTGLKELALLKEINNADPDGRYHCVKFIKNFMYKGHLCVVIEPLYMDMRKIIKKYGKHGLNLKAVMSYSRQLLMALRLLKKLGIVHADIKPDNILVNEKKNVLKLCDFGSATKVGESCEATPYLVSRFYRAPEIILGIPYKQSIDVWSAACTIYEMATGRIMFTGSSNNKMLKCFMDLKGRISSKMIRKGKFKDKHFNYNNSFLLHKKDEVTGREKFIEISYINPTRDIWPELTKSHKSLSPEIEDKLAQLKDLLEKMLVLDNNQRLSINDCLRHPFIQEKLESY